MQRLVRPVADAVSEPEELTLDTAVPPPRVLPGQPPDQLADLLKDRRSARVLARHRQPRADRRGRLHGRMDEPLNT